MIKKTKDYDLFRFREDNREAINQAHVKRLAESIKARNLLDLRPISVNSEYEVIDGQHRLLAAKSLGVEIYYQMQEGLKAEDIIIMNVSKSWAQADYLNYYCKNGYQEYIKLKDFTKHHNISLKVAINIMVGYSKTAAQEFKNGKFKFRFGRDRKQHRYLLGYYRIHKENEWIQPIHFHRLVSGRHC